MREVWYPKNKKRHAAVVKKRKRKKHLWLHKYKEEQGCSSCGERDGRCLDLHHLDSEEKKDNLAYMILHHSQKTIEKELAKCVVLCANCHRKLHYKERNF